MTTRQTDRAALVARCKRAGWSVTVVGDGDRIVALNGWTTVLHRTFSDINALRQAERNMKRYGLLLKDEEKAEAKRAKAKEARAVAAKKTADNQLKLAATRKTATSRAAGPYAGPEDIPLSWFLREHPAPCMRWARITPELAKELLKRNTDNRPSKQSTVEYYRQLIMAGKWHLTHQGMAMDTRGVLQDGQQRLEACVDAGEPISAPFFVGMPPENFKAIDEGRNRSIADLFGKDGEAHAVLLGGTLRLIAAYREPYPRAFLKLKTPNELLYDAFKGDPGNLAADVKWGKANYVKTKVVAGALSAAAYLLHEANGRDNDFVAAFLSGLVSGRKGDSRVMLDADDPRLLLRQNMQERRERGNRMRAMDQLGFVLLAWNLIVDRSQAGKRIRWVEGRDEIPHIVICDDKGLRASAPPEMLRGEFIRENER